MAELTLEVVRREETGKGVAKKLRKAGKVPAIVYGGHREAVPITVDRKSVTDLLTKSEHGVRSVFLLKMAGGDKKRHAMVKELDRHPITRDIRHIDFVRVLMDEKVRVTIPVRLDGTAAGVKLGGIIDFQSREIHVECLPGAIPDEFIVDVSPLQINDFIRVSELPIQEGVKILEDESRVIVSVSAPRAEAVPETEEEEEIEPEVIRKGKAEEEE